MSDSSRDNTVFIPSPLCPGSDDFGGACQCAWAEHGRKSRRCWILVVTYLLSKGVAWSWFGRLDLLFYESSNLLPSYRYVLTVRTPSVCLSVWLFSYLTGNRMNKNTLVVVVLETRPRFLRTVCTCRDYFYLLTTIYNIVEQHVIL